MTRLREDLVVAAALTAMVGCAVASTAWLGPTARRMPLVVGIPTLALLAVELVRLIRAESAESDARHGDELRAFSWIGGLLLLVLTTGMAAGVPAFLLLYVRGHFAERWRTAVVMGVTTGLLLVGVLELGLGLSLYQGLIGGWLVERLR